MKSIFDREYLELFRKQEKLQPFRIKQIIHEIFINSVLDFEHMTTLSKDLREKFKENFQIIPLKIQNIIDSKDTTKFAFETIDGQIIESVIMYHRSKIEEKKLNRITICLSSQIGCPIKCDFCVTGKLGFNRNLTMEEIVGQLLFANNYIKNKFGKKEDGTWRKVRNVVFMGMGEPLLNYENVKNSIEYMIRQEHFSLSKRHITISTAGIIPGIEKLINDGIEVMLAISLHSPDQNLREKLMPIAKSYNLENLIKTINQYIQKTGNRIFYEYIMIKGVTDNPELAEKLSKLLSGQLCHVNLIAYNENPATNYKESDTSNIKTFKQILEKNGITVTIRDSMGREQKGACGQLGYDKLNDKK